MATFAETGAAVTFTQMLRALRNQDAKIIGFAYCDGVPCWKLLERSTRFFYYVPLPEGWRLPQ